MRVAVVGAGPAGCAAAIELCRRGGEAILIGDEVDAVGEQLPPSARPLLQRLDLLPLAHHLECVGVRSAWESPVLQGQDFLFHPFGAGWLLDRRAFGAELRRRAADAGAVMHVPARLRALRRERAGWHLIHSHGELDCDWVVDASGRSAAVARRLGIVPRRYDHQVALLGWLAADEDDVDATLTVEATGDGWWYTCRLPGRRRVAAWVTSTRPHRRAWEEKLRATTHIAALVRGYRLQSQIVARPAGSSLLERVAGPGWLAIGDAAASYDPLASRGLVAALQAGIDAADLVGASAARLAAHDHAVEERFNRYLEERSALQDLAPRTPSVAEDAKARR